jgi:hypothetical protein
LRKKGENLLCPVKKGFSAGLNPVSFKAALRAISS